VLGWEPRVGAEEGLCRTIEWFRLEELVDGDPSTSLVVQDLGGDGAEHVAGLRSAR
jgi:hypothetical protein